MTTAPDLVAQILRLYMVEKWRAGTIARQLRVHRDVVRRVIAGNSAPVHLSPLRPSRIDPYRPFLLETLAIIKFGNFTKRGSFKRKSAVTTAGKVKGCSQLHRQPHG